MAYVFAVGYCMAGWANDRPGGGCGAIGHGYNFINGLISFHSDSVIMCLQETQ